MAERPELVEMMLNINATMAAYEGLYSAEPIKRAEKEVEKMVATSLSMSGRSANWLPSGSSTTVRKR